MDIVILDDSLTGKMFSLGNEEIGLFVMLSPLFYLALTVRSLPLSLSLSLSVCLFLFVCFVFAGALRQVS